MEPLHPFFIHVPLGLAVLIPFLSIGLLLAWWKGWFPRRIWIIATVFHAVFTLSTFIAMQTGERDEHIAERAVSEELIHEHEEHAERFLWSTVGILLLSLIGAVAKDEKAARRFALGATVLTLGSAFLAFETGEHGGELVYEYGAARAFTDVKYGGVGEGKDLHHKDEKEKSKKNQEKEH